MVRRKVKIRFWMKIRQDKSLQYFTNENLEKDSKTIYHTGTLQYIEVVCI